MIFNVKSFITLAALVAVVASQQQPPACVLACSQAALPSATNKTCTSIADPCVCTDMGYQTADGACLQANCTAADQAAAAQLAQQFCGGASSSGTETTGTATETATGTETTETATGSATSMATSVSSGSSSGSPSGSKGSSTSGSSTGTSSSSSSSSTKSSAAHAQAEFGQTGLFTLGVAAAGAIVGGLLL